MINNVSYHSAFLTVALRVGFLELFHFSCIFFPCKVKLEDHFWTSALKICQCRLVWTHFSRQIHSFLQKYHMQDIILSKSYSVLSWMSVFLDQTMGVGLGVSSKVTKTLHFPHRTLTPPYRSTKHYSLTTPSRMPIVAWMILLAVGPASCRGWGTREWH